ncbi:metal-dependent hydrolase [Scytonema sp. NUACC26]|uniref:metal-dependent hydrolase n=1 Tax=Scytonema sp. NUACC26 TaxID=3140176 RepID=UPI0034DB9EF9
MMGLTHLLISGTATSLILGTANPSILMVGATAGLLPDVDISTSPAGRVLFPVSQYLERRFPHRSCTHSLAASTVVATLTYGLTFFLPNSAFWLILAHAINIGYFFGWFADAFTRNGIEMFWPSSVRCVCPGNRNLRLASSSNAEYGVLVMLVLIAFISFNINSNGGLLNQFNRLIASPSGVEQIYNQSGATHLITVRIQGVLSSDRAKVLGEYLIVGSYGQGFLVLSSDGKLYKAGKEPDCQIIIEQITADVGQVAITNVESITLDDENLGSSLNRFYRPGVLTFVTGEIAIDDPEDIKLTPDPHQFPFIRLSGSSIKLESAPLGFVIQVAKNQFATGQLSIKSITKNG